MKIDPATEGWLIDRGNGRFYHLTPEWFDEMYRHQVKPYGTNPDFNRLRYAFDHGADASEIAQLFQAFIKTKNTNQARGRIQGPPSELHNFIRRRQRDNRNADNPN